MISEPPPPFGPDPEGECIVGALQLGCFASMVLFVTVGRI